MSAPRCEWCGCALIPPVVPDQRGHYREAACIDALKEENAKLLFAAHAQREEIVAMRRAYDRACDTAGHHLARVHDIDEDLSNARAEIVRLRTILKDALEGTTTWESEAHAALEEKP